MHMRMFLVEVTGDEILRVPDTHLFHVVKGDTRHRTICQVWFILFGEAQGDVPDRFCHLAVHLRLDIEAHGNGVLVLHEQAVACHCLCSLVLVEDVVHHTLEVAPLYDFRHHIPILLISS